MDERNDHRWRWSMDVCKTKKRGSKQDTKIQQEIVIFLVLHRRFTTVLFRSHGAITQHSSVVTWIYAQHILLMLSRGANHPSYSLVVEFVRLKVKKETPITNPTKK